VVLALGFAVRVSLICIGLACLDLSRLSLGLCLFSLSVQSLLGSGLACLSPGPLGLGLAAKATAARTFIGWRLNSGERLIDELDDHHRSSVTWARTEPEDARVATVPASKAWCDLDEQLADDVLVMHHGQHSATTGDVASLGKGDEALSLGAQPLGLS